MNILILSRGRAKDFVWDKPWAAISISSPGGEHPELSEENRLKLLRMTFFDFDTPRQIHEEFMEFFFNKGHAEQILDFVDEVQDKIDLLLVHCEAGVSRSPAVGAAISRLKWGKDQVFFDKYTPNRLVYSKILEVGHERTKSPEDLVSMATCGSCGKWVIYEKGNHHPWCLGCMDDQLDWAGGYNDITRAEAERIKKGDDE